MIRRPTVVALVILTRPRLLRLSREDYPMKQADVSTSLENYEPYYGQFHASSILGSKWMTKLRTVLAWMCLTI